MAKIKVSINKANCISCGSCFASAPDVFEIDQSDGLAKIVDSLQGVEITDPELIAKIRSAKMLCPNDAVFIEELEA